MPVRICSDLVGPSRGRLRHRVTEVCAEANLTDAAVEVASPPPPPGGRVAATAAVRALNGSARYRAGENQIAASCAPLRESGRTKSSRQRDVLPWSGHVATSKDFRAVTSKDIGAVTTPRTFNRFRRRGGDLHRWGRISAFSIEAARWARVAHWH